MIRLPIGEEAIPELLRKRIDEARNADRYTDLIAATEGAAQDTVTRAIHVWALAAEVNSGVFIDDVPHDAARAQSLWETLREDLPESPTVLDFEEDLDALVVRARGLARRSGRPWPPAPPDDSPLTSEMAVMKAYQMKGSAAADVFRDAADLAETEGKDRTFYDGKAALADATDQNWIKAEPGLRALVFENAHPNTEVGLQMAEHAAWYLCRIAVQRRDTALLDDVWAKATARFDGFPNLSVMWFEVLDFAMQTGSDHVGRAIWKAIQADKGQNRHVYGLGDHQRAVLDVAQSRYRKRFLGLF